MDTITGQNTFEPTLAATPKRLALHDNLKTPNQLIYFTNDTMDSTIEFSINTALKPTMWFKERDDIITTAKYTCKNFNTKFPEYIDVDKLVVQFGEYTSPCLCASIKNTYVSIITLNNNYEHKASYKLHLYKYVDSRVGYTEVDTYYSYFS